MNVIIKAIALIENLADLGSMSVIGIYRQLTVKYHATRQAQPDTAFCMRFQLTGKDSKRSHLSDCRCTNRRLAANRRHQTANRGPSSWCQHDKESVRERHSHSFAKSMDQVSLR